MKERFKSMNAYIEAVDSGIIVYSYNTPIMAKKGRVWYDSEKKYSSTTSKQKTIIKRELSITTLKTINHEDFKVMVDKMGASSLGYM